MTKKLHFLLADDDTDDRFFFNKALKVTPGPPTLTVVEDGEKLMDYLSVNSHQLPDALFLDLNMPRKNGSECLIEIKRDERLKSLPVIIYSTSLHEEVADVLYSNGAHYYIKKTDLVDLQKGLNHIFKLLGQKEFTRPSRSEFVLTLSEAQ